MARDYPWYEVVDGPELMQGDLLMGLPVIAPAPELSFPLPEEDLPVSIEDYDVVVMTQACDLAQNKVEQVTLCPHWDLEDAGRMDRALARRDAGREIASGRRPRYLMLARSTGEITIEPRIVDFGRPFSLPKTYLCQFAATCGRRLRLCPPYREHLSQGFARFYMRVGLPQDIDL